MNDHDLIECIRSGKNNKAMRQLYNYLPVIRSLILKNGGTRQDALDVYQDALVVFCINVSRPDFVLSSGIHTYLFSISKNKWKEELRKRGREEKLTWDVKDEVDVTELNVHEEKLNRLQTILKEVGDKCQRMFSLFYFQKLDMKTIAAKLGYTSEQNAATQKFKCMERARKLAQDKNILS
ncbi:MAG: RNA polymerase sigma factor [Flavobacteriales bacterium]